MASITYDTGSEIALMYMEKTATWAMPTIGRNFDVNSIGISIGRQIINTVSMGETMSSDTSIWRFTVRLVAATSLLTDDRRGK